MIKFSFQKNSFQIQDYEDEIIQLKAKQQQHQMEMEHCREAQEQPTKFASNSFVHLESSFFARRGANSEEIPHSNHHGMPSLHHDLVRSVIKEIVRLHNLREVIQEECDFLSLQKERMKRHVYVFK